MTTKYFLFCAALLASVSAQAYGPVNPSRMDQLIRAFNTSGAPQLDQMVGWHPGRCYRTSNQNFASGNMLVIDRRPSVGPDGSLHNAAASLKTKLIVVGKGKDGRDAKARYYEHIDEDERRDLEIEINRLAQDPEISEAYYSNKSLVGKVHENLYEVREDAKYYYLRGVIIGQHDPSYLYCYFYKDESYTKGH
jgi:hypothetical protein